MNAEVEKTETQIKVIPTGLLQFILSSILHKKVEFTIIDEVATLKIELAAVRAEVESLKKLCLQSHGAICDIQNGVNAPKPVEVKKKKLGWRGF